MADFSFIDDILVNKLHQLVQEEFIPDKIFIFGFSFGGQLALEAGRKFGKKLIGRIDGNSKNQKKKKILLEVINSLLQNSM